MTRTRLGGLGPMLLAGAFAMGAGSTASAEELRIGFLAAMTGPFAAVGKDMVDGFQLYLDEHKNGFGGAQIKFILEDEQAKPDVGVTKRASSSCRTTCTC